MTPQLSIVMPVHNGMPYLGESINSILEQTFKNFEFVIVENGSTDESPRLLREIARRDERVRVFSYAQRLGPAGSSNTAVTHSSAEFVARMDADDVVYPERLRRQVEVLRIREAAVLVGTLSEGIDSRGRLIRHRDRALLLSRRPAHPFPHGSVMFRRSAFDQVGGYREDADLWEDLDFFMRLSRLGQVLVIPEALYRYRFHPLNHTTVSNMSDATDQTMRRLASVDIHRAGGDFSSVLSGEIGNAKQRRRAQFVSYTIAAGMTVWCGQSPTSLGIRRPKGIPPARSLFRTVVYGMCGSRAPRLVRALISPWIRLRDLVGTLLLPKGPVEWRFKPSS